MESSYAPRQAEGFADRDILPLVLHEFPWAKTTLNSIRWYRSRDKTKLHDKTWTPEAHAGDESRGTQTLLPINPHNIAFSVLKKHGIEDLDGFKLAKQKAKELRKYLHEPGTQQKICDKHILGATSLSIQEIFLEKAIDFGFENERIGLYTRTAVPGLRPDYYCELGETGILLEVERGRTISNNMDLLDLWKCHVCDCAHYLFLLVPRERQTGRGASPAPSNM